MRDLSNDRALLAINSATVKAWSLEQLVEGCARAGISAIAPWRDIVQACGVERAGQPHPRARHDRDRPLPRRHVSGRRRGRPPRRARRQPPRRRRGGRDRRALPGAGRRRAAEGLARTSPARTRRCATGSRRCCPTRARPACRSRSSRCIRCIAADRACVNTLAHANDLCDELGDGARRRGRRLSCVVGPGSAARRSRAPARRILTYHVCDWLVPTRDLLLDRGMPGDGVIDLRAIRAMVEAAGYSRPLRGRDLLGRELVEARSRRGAAHLHRAAPDRGVMTQRLRLLIRHADVLAFWASLEGRRPRHCGRSSFEALASLGHLRMTDQNSPRGVTKTTYDGIILGAGHNGLILQAYLGKAGLKTLSIERAAVAGGGLATLEDPRHPGLPAQHPRVLPARDHRDAVVRATSSSSATARATSSRS